MRKILYKLLILCIFLAVPQNVFAQTVTNSLTFTLTDNVGWKKSLVSASQVTETYNYTSSTDTLTIDCAFNATGFAPLPPMLGLAYKYGLSNTNSPFQISVNKTVVDKGNTNSSIFGPLLGVENTNSYTLTIKGLKRYVSTKTFSTGSVPAEIQTDLDTQVDKIIAAGHLKPSLFQTAIPGSGNQGRGGIFWLSPAEVHYFLAEVYLLVSTARQTSIKTYLQSEKTNFPPEDTRGLPYWGTGTFREAVPPSEWTLARWWDGEPNADSYSFLKFKTTGAAKIWNLYGLSKYYSVLTNETPNMGKINPIVTNNIANRDWATLYWKNGSWPEYNAVHAVNQLFAGFVGYIKLATKANDTNAQNLGWGYLSKMAALRFSMGKYTQFLYDTGRFTFPSTNPRWLADEHASRATSCCIGGDLITFNFTKAIDNTNQIHRLDDQAVWISDWWGNGAGVQGSNPSWAMTSDGQSKNEGPYANGSNWDELGWHSVLSPYLLPFTDVVPELGRFMKDTLQPEIRVFSNRIAENQPHWYAAYSDAQVSYENGYMQPSDSYGNFLIHAWVLDTDKATLAKFIDYPWVKTGDFYYLHKLAETAKTYKGWSWSDAGSSPTAIPTSTALPGDANGDNKVDGIDYVIWLNHYGQNISGSANGDFNSDNKVDGIDYVIWLNHYSG